MADIPGKFGSLNGIQRDFMGIWIQLDTIDIYIYTYNILKVGYNGVPPI